MAETEVTLAILALEYAQWIAARPDLLERSASDLLKQLREESKSEADAVWLREFHNRWQSAQGKSIGRLPA